MIYSPRSYPEQINHHHHHHQTYDVLGCFLEHNVDVGMFVFYWQITTYILSLRVNELSQ